MKNLDVAIPPLDIPATANDTATDGAKATDAPKSNGVKPTENGVSAPKDAAVPTN